MRHFYLIVIISVLFIACASSQSNIAPQVKTKVSEWRSLLKLSAEQVKQLNASETNYLIKSGKLNNIDSDYPSRLKKLQDKRIDYWKKILSREQFIKLQVIEKNLIKEPLPLQS